MTLRQAPTLRSISHRAGQSEGGGRAFPDSKRGRGGGRGGGRKVGLSIYSKVTHLLASSGCLKKVAKKVRSSSPKGVIVNRLYMQYLCPEI